MARSAARLSLLNTLTLVLAYFFLALTAYSQITSLMTPHAPTAGVGHDYIKLLGETRIQRLRGIAWAFLLAGCLAMISCGGGSNGGSPNPTSNTYTLTLTAASGTDQQTTSVTLNVQ